MYADLVVPGALPGMIEHGAGVVLKNENSAQTGVIADGSDWKIFVSQTLAALLKLNNWAVFSNGAIGRIKFIATGFGAYIIITGGDLQPSGTFNVYEISNYSSLTNMINRIVVKLEELTLRTLRNGPEQKTIYVDGTGREDMMIPAVMVDSIDEIKIGDDVIEIAYARTETGIVRAKKALERGAQNVEVKVTAGWNETTVPEGLLMAMSSLVEAASISERSKGAQVASWSFDGFSQSYGGTKFSGLIANRQDFAFEIIDHYRSKII